MSVLMQAYVVLVLVGIGALFVALGRGRLAERKLQPQEIRTDEVKKK